MSSSSMGGTSDRTSGGIFSCEYIKTVCLKTVCALSGCFDAAELVPNVYWSFTSNRPNLIAVSLADTPTTSTFTCTMAHRHCHNPTTRASAASCTNSGALSEARSWLWGQHKTATTVLTANQGLLECAPRERNALSFSSPTMD